MLSDGNGRMRLELNESASLIYSTKNFYKNEKIAIIEVKNE